MKLVRQINSTTCGQACVATLMQMSIEDAIEQFGHDGITSDDEMLSVLNLNSGFVSGKPPADTLAIQKHKDPNGNREHWTVHYYGETLDPAQIGKRLWPVYKYVVIPQVGED